MNSAIPLRLVSPSWGQVSVMEKALPSGSRKANIGGTPGQVRTSSVSTPAAVRVACAAVASSVVNLIVIGPRVTSL